MKTWMKGTMALGVCVTVVCGFAGCVARGPGGFGGRDISWSHSYPGSNPTPGIDEASVRIGVWGDGAALVVWSDASAGSLGASGMGGVELRPGESRKGVRYQGRLLAPDGRSVEVVCHTPDGRTGTVNIGDSEYDLADGGLFLLSIREGEPRVRQLPLGRLDLQPSGSKPVDAMDRETLEGIATTDPDIGSFFAETSKSEPNRRASQ